MFYEEVSDLFLELESLSMEKNLIKNLKLIAYSFDSSKQENFIKYFQNVVNRILHLSKSPDSHYSLYILSNIIFFLKEAKKYNINIFKEPETFKIMVAFFDFVKKFLKNKNVLSDENEEIRREIIEIVENNFVEEYYFKKNNNFISKQYNLPF